MYDDSEGCITKYAACGTRIILRERYLKNSTCKKSILIFSHLGGVCVYVFSHDQPLVTL